jgi:nitrite reductase (NADH) small subunit
MPWHALCSIEDLKEGAGKYVEAAGLQLAVFLHDGHPRVIDNYCPHAGGNLAAGVIEDGCAVCPWHDWAFQLDSGYLKHSTVVRVETYPTRLNGSTVEADLPAR